MFKIKNRWVPIDTQIVLPDDKTIQYNYNTVCDFFKKLFKLNDSKSQWIDVWRYNTRIDLLYWNNKKLICTATTSKMNIYYTNGRMFPFLSDEDKNEFDFICLTIRSNTESHFKSYLD